MLRTHPQVADVGVVGVPDEELGERVGAVVVTSGPVTAEELVAHCADRMATYKVPEFVVLADELPTSVLGKLDRRGLRRQLHGGASPCPAPGPDRGPSPVTRTPDRRVRPAPGVRATVRHGGRRTATADGRGRQGRSPRWQTTA